MKKSVITLCCTGSLLVFMLLPFFPQAAYGAVPESQQNQPAAIPLLAQETTQQAAPPATGEELGQAVPSEKKRTKHPILMYLPNRFFDLLDIFRVRVRVGPGISVGARVTKPVSAFVGFHSTVFVGLPGPRGKAKLPLPAGIENRGGVQASIVDLSSKETYYDPLEVGLEVQPLIAGVNIGIGVFEILDFATGLVFIDLKDDDF